MGINVHVLETAKMGVTVAVNVFLVKMVGMVNYAQRDVQIIVSRLVIEKLGTVTRVKFIGMAVHAHVRDYVVPEGAMIVVFAFLVQTVIQVKLVLINAQVTARIIFVIEMVIA